MIRSTCRFRAAFFVAALTALGLIPGVGAPAPAMARTLQCASYQQFWVRDTLYRADSAGIVDNVANNDVLAMIQAGCGFVGGAGSGDVTGPVSASNGSVATFNGTSGKILEDSGKALPGGVIVGTTDTQTITNKNINCSNNTCLNFPGGGGTPAGTTGDIQTNSAGRPHVPGAVSCGPGSCKLGGAANSCGVSTSEGSCRKPRTTSGLTFTKPASRSP